MFSISKTQEIEKWLAAIDLQLSVTQPFQYQLRAALKDEKKQLLRQLEQDKGKQKIISSSPVLYNPIELYKGYTDGHEDR